MQHLWECVFGTFMVKVRFTETLTLAALMSTLNDLHPKRTIQGKSIKIHCNKYMSVYLNVPVL